MDDLGIYGVPVLILSGAKPLMRPDIFDIAQRAKAMGFIVGLSSNGTLITPTSDRSGRRLDYVGVSLTACARSTIASARPWVHLDELPRAAYACAWKAGSSVCASPHAGQCARPARPVAIDGDRGHRQVLPVTP